ncbi:MAG: hypothetical protein ABUT20_63995 [Bacteroidota bacterium]
MKLITLSLSIGLSIFLITISSFTNFDLYATLCKKSNNNLDREISKIKLVSVNEVTVKKFIESEGFKNSSNNGNKIDENEIKHIFIEDQTISLYTLKLKNQDGIEFAIYKMEDGSTCYVIYKSIVDKEGNKNNSLSDINGQLLYKYKLTCDKKVEDFFINETAVIKINPNSESSIVDPAVSVAACVRAAKAECDASWSCQAMCMVLGPNTCEYMWLIGCLAK